MGWCIGRTECPPPAAVGTSTQRDQAIRAASAGRDVVQSADADAVRAGSIECMVVEGNSPPWLILAFAVALLLDSPLRWPEQIWRAVRGRRGEAGAACQRQDGFWPTGGMTLIGSERR